MSANDVIALNAKLGETKKERASSLNEAEFFELFAAEQALKDFEPSDDDIEAGQVGGENDGGLDSIYFLVNKQFVTDETEIDPKTVTRADLVLIQATRETAFNESRVEKLNLLTEDLLDLSRGEGQLKGTYNAELLSAITRFKDKYKALFHVPHNLTISYYYISKGDIKVINAALNKHQARVVQKARDLFSDATVSFMFVGAAELLKLVNKHPLKTYPLTLAHGPIWPKGQDAVICLVPLTEYYKFIVDERGEIRDQLFESNVRDWQGNIKVNEEIKQTLEDKSAKEDFWWLNNGITILASRVSTTGGHILSVETPQIVNGLQTSRAIFNYVHSLKYPNIEGRNVLVRVIAAKEAESPDHIIKATNSQTVVPEFSLHMTQKIHRDIETLLRSYNLFYDRRKNYYKNENRPIARIIQPLNLAQTVISVVLQKPDDARARPTTVLNKEHDKVFSASYPLLLYANCALLMKKIDAFLASREFGVVRSDRTNLRWYLAMQYTRAITSNTTPSTDELSKMTIPSGNDLLKACYKKVNEMYRSLGGTDKVAKGPDLVLKLKGN